MTEPGHFVDYWRDHPNPSDEEIDAVCRAWLRYHSESRGGGDEDHPDWWAAEAVMDLISEPLELEWRVTRKLAERAKGANENAVAMIGIGPVESLLHGHGEDAMDLIEPAADEIPALLTALQSVWCSDPMRSRLDSYLAAKSRSRS